jgi:hypothetical protein
MEVDLCSHLKFNGEKFYWDSTITDLKVFVTWDLKLTGRWLSPGGEVKTFTSDTLVLKWHGKTNKWITLSGSSTEVSELSQTLQSLCKKAEENQADIAEIHQTLPTKTVKKNRVLILSHLPKTKPNILYDLIMMTSPMKIIFLSSRINLKP